MESYKKKNDIGNKLQEILKERNITVTELANSIGINRVTVQRYLSGAKYPSDKTLGKIAEFFELPVEYFTGEPYDSEGNIIESMKDKLSDKLDNIKYAQYRKNAINAFNYCFDAADNETKSQMLLDLFDLQDRAKNGVRMLDLATDSMVVTKISNILDNNYVSASNKAIEDALKKTSTEGIIESSHLNDFYVGVEVGSIVSRDDKNSRIIQLVKKSKNSVNERAAYDNESLYSFEEMISSIINNNFYDAIKKLDTIMEKIDHKENTRDFDFEKMKDFQNQLVKLDLMYFDMYLNLISYLIDKDIESFKNSLSSLREVLITENGKYFDNFHRLLMDIVSESNTIDINEVSEPLVQLMKILTKNGYMK